MDQSRLTSSVVIMIILLSVAARELPAQSEALPPRGGGAVASGSVIVETRADEQIALMEVLAGKLDLVYGSLDPARVASLPQGAERKLRIVSSRNISLSLLANAAPDRAPWLATGRDGIQRFNPLAMREARNALNRLLDRRALSREIGGQGATPLLLPFSIGDPGALPWYRSVLAAGLRFGGDGSAAKDFRAAMERAAALPALSGRLLEADGAWRFDGETLVLRLLTRSDQPGDALPAARWLARVIEGLGLRVEIVDRGRAEAARLVAMTDPSDLAWNLRVERWGAGETAAWQDEVVAEMYSDRSWTMTVAGEGLDGAWRPSTRALDEDLERLERGGFRGPESYEEVQSAAAAHAMEDSFRIFLFRLDRVHVLAAGSFPEPPPFDRGAGIASPWFWRGGAGPGPGASGPLRVGVVTRAASVFDSSWEPLFRTGLLTPVSRPVIHAIADEALWIVDPTTGLPAWFSESFVEARPRVSVPSAAKVWDGAAHAWRPLGPGRSALARVVFDYSRGGWHSGVRSSPADALHYLALLSDWCVQDGPGDPCYDRGAEAAWSWLFEDLVAVEALPEGRLADYLDRDWAAFPERLAAYAYLPTGLVHWTIAEALLALEREGDRSGARWTFAPDDRGPGLNVLDPRAVAEIRAKLAAFREARRVPASISELLSENEALAAWSAAIDFVDRHGHAFVSNGPYLLDRVGFSPPAFELARFGDYRGAPRYPGGGPSPRLARVDLVKAPILARAAEGFELEVRVSSLAFPGGLAEAAPSGTRVRVRLVGDDGELLAEALPVGEGLFRARFSAGELAGLGTGVAIVLAEASIGGTLPDLGIAELLVAP